MVSEEPIRNVVRVADALDAMASGNNRLSGIARELGVSRSSIHRILKSMEAAGLALQDPVSGGYHIGPRIIALLGAASISHQYLSISAHSEIEALSRRLGETVSLVVRAGLEKIVVQEVLGGDGAKISVGRGFVSTLALGATSRVILAQLDLKERTALLPLLMPDETEKTLSETHAKIDEVSRRGFDVSYGEYLKGVCAIAVPVLGYSTPAALSILTHIDRVSDQRRDELVTRMQETVAKIEAKLGSAVSQAQEGAVSR